MTKIEWVKNPEGTQGMTLNPIKGICPIACSYCYARRMYKRFGWGKTPQYIPSVMEELRSLKKPTGIFLCSTFEWLWNTSWAHNIIDKVREFPQHRFYLLTKRPELLEQFSPFPTNCWVGVSATNYDMANSARYYLSNIKAKIKFISFEPLLNRIADRSNCPFRFEWGTDWVIIGAQTPYSKKTAPRVEWVKEIVESADKSGIPVFLKNNLWKAVVKPHGIPPLWARSREDADILRQEMPIK